MCWNASVSINTFLLGLFAMALAVGNGVTQPRRCLFFLSFVSMQLVEAFLWRNLGRPAANRAGSVAGYALLILQPLASLASARMDARTLALSAGAYVALVALALTAGRPWSSIDFSARRAADGHLAWGWLDRLPVWILLPWLFFFVFRFAYEREWLSLALVVGSLALVYATHARSGTWGSLWCWLANAVSIFLIAKVFYKDLCLR